MSDKVKRLLETLSNGETQLLATPFLAPCVRGGKVRTRLNGLVYTFSAKPRDFEGWGIFKPASDTSAMRVEEPGLPLVVEYLKLFKQLRARLAHQLQGQSWLAYPNNESDAKQRFGAARPFALHLVDGGAQFEQVKARYDGAVYWFEDIDRSGDPLAAERLRDEMKNFTLPENLAFKALTPETRTAYDLAFQQTAEFRRKAEQSRDETRLKQALDVAGGELKSFRDRGDYWTVEWTTGGGERLSSAIVKSDLTVMSSGICLSGRDRDFDLTSLVGVVERSNDWD